MLLFNIVLFAISLYLAVEEYHNGRIVWAMFWAMLVGWDLHVLVTI